MRSTTLVARILCTLFVFASLSAAWPWPPSVGSKGHGMVIKRQDNNDDKNTDKNTETEDAKPTATAESGTATETGKAKETATGTKTDESEETGTETGTKTGEATETETDIDPRLPAGGIKMVDPPPLAQTTYYKIGDHVTFKWNYTSLSVTPTGINVVASCAINSHTYTITANDTVAETGAVIWDTGAYQADATVPLLTETYTLLVYDVDRNPTDVAPAGHLGASNPFMFGMYIPKEPTPLSEWECATCSAAFSTMERQALGFAFSMFAITVLSFAWFANGFGVFS